MSDEKIQAQYPFLHPKSGQFGGSGTVTPACAVTISLRGNPVAIRLESVGAPELAMEGIAFTYFQAVTMKPVRIFVPHQAIEFMTVIPVASVNGRRFND